MTMTAKAILFIFAVPLLNIVLGTLARSAGTAPISYWSALRSPAFAAAFAVGTISLLCLVALYKEGVPLYQGFLLMGALSIIGGTLWGVILAAATPTISEWMLLALIAAVLSLRLWNA